MGRPCAPPQSGPPWAAKGTTTPAETVVVQHGSNDAVAIQYLELDAYQAGACNIGPAEIARRRRAGIGGVAVAVALAAILVAVGAPDWARVLVLPPLALGIISLDQARRRFCVGFAMAGLRNFDALGREERIEDDAARAADRRAALGMVLQGTLVAAAITAVFVLLPI
jgi:hypothetical protein